MILLVLALTGWYPPEQYIPEVILISKVDEQAVRTICEMNRESYGCTMITGKVVRIYILPSVTNCQLLHELKHATGWKHPTYFTDCY
jgi:hypothetical protein